MLHFTYVSVSLGVSLYDTQFIVIELFFFKQGKYFVVCPPTQCGEWLVDVGPLLEPLPDGPSLVRPLRAGQVNQRHPRHLLTPHTTARQQIIF